MTTIIAIRCLDGVVMCADSQETVTHPLPTGVIRVKQEATKLRQIRDLGLFASSGNSDDIEAFSDFFEKSLKPSNKEPMEESLDKVVRAFVKKRADREKMMHVDLKDYGDMEAIFGVYDRWHAGQTRLFRISPPSEPKEIKTAYTDTGTGSVFSTFIFGMTRQAMDWLKLEWLELPSTLALKYCSIVMALTKDYDLSSGGSPHFGVADEKGIRIYDSDAEFFEPGRSRVAVAFEELLSRYPAYAVPRLRETYLDDKSLKALKALVQLFSGSLDD